MNGATDKQIAYLKYMGYKNPEKLSCKEASSAMSKLGRDLPDSKIEEFVDRQRKWSKVKFELYPDLYRDEMNIYLVDELHQYIRTRVVGASERLTKEKIKKIIKELDKNELDWWRRQDFKEAFFEALSKAYPGCVDGKPPQKKTDCKRPEANSSGCLSMLVFGLSLGTLLMLIHMQS